jgi:hypothetical protein
VLVALEATLTLHGQASLVQVLAVFMLVVAVALLATLVLYQWAVQVVAETDRALHLLRQLLELLTLALAVVARSTD